MELEQEIEEVIKNFTNITACYRAGKYNNHIINYNTADIINHSHKAIRENNPDLSNARLNEVLKSSLSSALEKVIKSTKCLRNIFGAATITDAVIISIAMFDNLPARDYIIGAGSGYGALLTILFGWYIRKTRAYSAVKDSVYKKLAKI